MNNNIQSSIRLTDNAVSKIREFIKNKNSDLKLKFRIYIVGGGCGGFQYGFVLDHEIGRDDYIIKNNGFDLVIDPMSLQYLFGGIVDYREELLGSRFIVINPNAKTTCSCGSSFSV